MKIAEFQRVELALVGFAQMGTFSFAASAREYCLSLRSLAQVSLAQMGTAQISLAQMGIAQVASAQVYSR